MGVHGLAPSHRRLLGAAVLVVAGLLLLLHHLHGGGSGHRVVVPLRTAAPAHRAAALLVVDVAGGVRRPGLYRLRQGSRVADAVARAGGPRANAEVALVNLAAPLADGEQVVVPQRGAAGAAAGSPNAPVDLNTASAEQLDALPGIGPATAAKIVQYRQAHGPFRSADDLDAVPGIGPSRIAQLKGLVLP